MSRIGWIIAIGGGTLLIAWILISVIFIGPYNNMVSYDEEVVNTWAKVESQYQRRADLIPNLVNVVKGYASHEKEVLTQVTQARASVGQVNVNANNLDPQALQKFQQAQGELSSALSRLLVVAERYPDLKANQNFLELQAQLEGTENRIAVARDRYNDAVKNYNSYIRKFPQKIVASMNDFEKKPSFEADKGAEKAPKVEF